MAYFKEPDRTEEYKHPFLEYKLVLNYHNDIPDLVTWYHVNKFGVTVDDSDIMSEHDIRMMIEAEGWIKI